MTSFSICHWNLNSIAAIQSLIAYDCMHHFDFICFSETYLNSNILSDNENLDIPGYRLVRSQHPSNHKVGGVCVYFKFFVLLQTLIISMLHECINLEITIDGNLFSFICLYRSLSQNMEKFGTFVKNFALRFEFIFSRESIPGRSFC